MQKNTFSMRLKTLLEQKQLTLAEVARAIDMSTPSVHRWTRGGEIEYDNLRALAKFLNVNWIWLRYGDEAIESLKESMLSSDSAADERRKYLGEIMENEARMSLAQDMARIVTWEWNVLTDELTVSSNSEQIFGRRIEEVRSSMLPFATFELEALIAKFTSSELAQEWDFNLPIVGSDDACWFASRGQMLFDAQGRPFKIVGISIDITQRKQLVSALERSEYMMRKIIETIPVGLWIADQSGHITAANPEAERIWGGVKLVELAHYGEYKGRWDNTGKEVGSGDWTLARAIQYGEVSRGEVVTIEAFDGKERTIIMSAIPLWDVNDKIIGAIEVNQDITTLKHIEESLRLTVEQWNSTFEQPLVGIAYCKTGSDTLHVNARFAELMGSSIKELANGLMESFLDEDTRREFKMHMQNTQVNAPTTFRLQGKLQCKDGTSNVVQLCVIYNPMPKAVFNKLVFVIETPAELAV